METAIPKNKGQVILYQNKVEVRLDKETVWLTQAQIAELFSAERSVVTKHIRNIFKSKELHIDSVCAKFAHTAQDGKVYKTQFYNLDMIISVGYRVNSKRGMALTLMIAASKPVEKGSMIKIILNLLK